MAYFDLTRFFKVPNVGTALVGTYGTGDCDRAVGAWRNCWIHWGGCGASGSQSACSERDSLFVGCREDNEYQRRFSGSLADVRRRPDVPTLVATDQLVFPEDSRRLYFVTRRA